MSIAFDESLATGNQLIDTQHQELIQRVNKLVESCAAGREKIAAIQTLDFLMDYTQFHFAAEEKLQEDTAYPQIEEHKAQHAVFVQAVKDLEEMLQEEEGPTEAFVAAVNKNITEWLLNHIKVWDKKVADFVKAR